MTFAYRPDCRHFRGDVPCAPHKVHQVHCDACQWYEPTSGRILIIKLGAVGDVIRSTPILHPLRRDFPQAAIHWLTHTPEVIPDIVNRVHPWRLEEILYLQATEFDLVINLDKDREACALATMVRAREKKGYLLRDGTVAPADAAAEGKFLTGLFDDIAKANKKSYPQELFEICGYTFAGEKYVLSNYSHLGLQWRIPQPRPLVGLNTGCGSRWKSRLWPEEYWVQLAKELRAKGLGVILLGGPQEDEKNRRLAEATGASYLGHFPLPQFINLVDQTDVVVTAVTMAVHIAIGLGKRVVLFNNTFNRHEFELYGLGEILEPEFSCSCFYAAECPNNCMQYLYPAPVLASCLRQVQMLAPGGMAGA